MTEMELVALDRTKIDLILVDFIKKALSANDIGHLILSPDTRAADEAVNNIRIDFDNYLKEIVS